MINFGKQALDKLPPKFKNTLFVRAFGLTKIPLLFFISPVIEELSDQRCAVRIPLNYRTKNHLNSMYFGVLAAGADVAGGLIAMKLIQEGGNDVALSFKDFTAEFLKRAEGDTVFSFEDGPAVADLVRKARETGERVNMPLNITATVPSKSGNEPVAKFVLTLSLKKREKRAS